MSFIQDMAMQQMKDQASQLIPKELQDKEEEDPKALDVKENKKSKPKKKNKHHLNYYITPPKKNIIK